MKTPNIEFKNQAAKKAHELGLATVYESLKNLNPMGAMVMIERMILTMAYSFGHWAQIAKAPTLNDSANDATLCNVWQSAIGEMYQDSAPVKVFHSIEFVKKLIKHPLFKFEIETNSDGILAKERDNACIAFFCFVLRLILDNDVESNKEYWFDFLELGELAYTPCDKALEIGLRFQKDKNLLPLMRWMKERGGFLQYRSNFNNMVARHLWRAIVLKQTICATDFINWTDILGPTIEYTRPFYSGSSAECLLPADVKNACATATKRIVDFAQAVAQIIKKLEIELQNPFNFLSVVYDLSTATLQSVNFEVISGHGDEVKPKIQEIKSLCESFGVSSKRIEVSVRKET